MARASGCGTMPSNNGRNFKWGEPYPAGLPKFGWAQTRASLFRILAATVCGCGGQGLDPRRCGPRRRPVPRRSDTVRPNKTARRSRSTTNCRVRVQAGLASCVSCLRRPNLDLEGQQQQLRTRSIPTSYLILQPRPDLWNFVRRVAFASVANVWRERSDGRDCLQISAGGRPTE
jgi:hypothetical protein